MNKKILEEDSILFKFLLSVKGFIITTLLFVFRIFPVKKNRILIISYYGKGFGDNPKYVANELLKSENYEIYWVLKDLNLKLPSKIKPVKYKSVFYYYILATSKIWINNCRFPFWIKKRKNQKYIQLWHGSIALKKIEFDVEEKLGYRYIKSAINDNKLIDYMISNSDFCTNNLYRGAFRYNKVIYEFGTPRNDLFLTKNKSIRKKVEDTFKLQNDNNILLYAPTFRKKYNGEYNIDFDSIIQMLEKKTKKNWKILVRLHPNVSDMADKYNFLFNKKILNASYYDDMQELIYSSDLIITDYSSIMFDAVVSDKPVILYLNDINNYNSERGTYFEINNLPFAAVKNNEELLYLLKNKSKVELMEKYSSFKKEIGLKESGQASKLVSKLIKKIINGDIDE